MKAQLARIREIFDEIDASKVPAERAPAELTLEVPASDIDHYNVRENRIKIYERDGTDADIAGSNCPGRALRRSGKQAPPAFTRIPRKGTLESYTATVKLSSVRVTAW